MRLTREPGDAGGSGQQPGGAGGTDPVQAGQCAAGGFEQVTEFFVRGLLALVDAFQVGDQLSGDPQPRLRRSPLRPVLRSGRARGGLLPDITRRGVMLSWSQRSTIGD